MSSLKDLYNAQECVVDNVPIKYADAYKIVMGDDWGKKNPTQRRGLPNDSCQGTLWRYKQESPNVPADYVEFSGQDIYDLQQAILKGEPMSTIPNKQFKGFQFSVRSNAAVLKAFQKLSQHVDITQLNPEEGKLNPEKGAYLIHLAYLHANNSWALKPVSEYGDLVYNTCINEMGSSSSRQEVEDLLKGPAENLVNELLNMEHPYKQAYMKLLSIQDPILQPLLSMDFSRFQTYTSPDQAGGFNLFKKFKSSKRSKRSVTKDKKRRSQKSSYY